MAEKVETQFKTEGEPAFPVENKENDNSAASSAGEETNVDQTQSDEGDETQTETEDGDKGGKGFADDPRWKERENDWTRRFNEQEMRHVSELTKFREDFENKLNEITSSKGSDNASESQNVPAWFGGEEEQWTEFLAWNNAQVNERLTAVQSEEQKRIDIATAYFNDQVVTIESDKSINPQGEKIDRNKLLKFVLDNDLVDSKGQWNYRAGFQMMKSGVVSSKTDAIKEKKDLANATTSEKHAETKLPTYTTSEDFSKPGARPW